MNSISQPSQTYDIVHKNHNYHQNASTKFVGNIDHCDNSMDQRLFCDVGDYHCKHFHLKDCRDNDNFDMLILQNFSPYSGRQNVVSWLDETERKFHQLKVPYNLRLQAISLLIEGEARRKYIQARRIFGRLMISMDFRYLNLIQLLYQLH